MNGLLLKIFAGVVFAGASVCLVFATASLVAILGGVPGGGLLTSLAAFGGAWWALRASRRVLTGERQARAWVRVHPPGPPAVPPVRKPAQPARLLPFAARGPR